jgi:predicted SAM-dependent methyltransferase
VSFDFTKYPRRINLGCGFDKKEGFLNLDINAFHDPDLVCDVTNLNLLPSAYYEYAIAQDVLEHIQRLKIRNTLKEWNRILKIGGVLELQVPNVIGLLKLLTKEENKTSIMQEKLLQCLFGTQAYDGDFHYFGFTDILIKSLLESTGFIIEQITIKDEWLFQIRARKTFDCHVDIEEILHLNDEGFVTEVYKIFLGRLPDESGFQYYLKILKDGIAREAIIESIKNSEEYKTKHA